MVTYVPTRDAIDALTRTAAFPYDEYVLWDGIGVPMHLLSTTLVEVRPRSEWNTLGRERYDRATMVRHAEVVVASLPDPVSRGRWLVRHAGALRRWIPESGGDPRLRAFLASHAAPGSRGGFVVDGVLETWLAQLVDCPFLLKAADVELVGLDEPWLIRVTHHLDVQLFTRDGEALDRVGTAVAAAGVRTQRVASPRGLSTEPESR